MPPVLIAESDPSTVFVAKRVLTRELGCSTVETDNGLDALHELSQRAFAAILLGMDVAGMSAFEMLSALRACPDTRDLPVVILTADKSELAVRRLAEHHVRYCLTKPLDAVRATATLRSVIDRAGRRLPNRQLTGVATALAEGAPLLIADADPDFRHFFVSLFGSHFRVLSASSGAEALKLVPTTRPAVVCAGDHLGPVDRLMLSRKLTEMRNLDAPALLAVTTRAQAAHLAQLGVFDGVLTRTFVPASFRTQFEAVIGRPSSLPRLVGRVPELRGSLMSAVEQSCGMMGGLDVEPLPTFPTEEEEAFSAVVDMAVAIDADTIGLRCTLSATPFAAGVMGAGMLGLPAADLSDEDKGSVLGELANIVTGRVQNSLMARGLPTKCGLPRLTVVPGIAPAPDPRALAAAFRIVQHECVLKVDLIGASPPDPQLVTALQSARTA